MEVSNQMRQFSWIAPLYLIKKKKDYKIKVPLLVREIIDPN